MNFSDNSIKMQRNSRVRFTLHAKDINERQYALELDIEFVCLNMHLQSE